MYDKNTSPVGWYLCSYLLRFIELALAQKEAPDTRFLSWENTVLIRADSIDDAYDKTVAIAEEESSPLGGAEKLDVQWVFEGITEVLPIYEELKDGAEIMWREIKPRKLKNLRMLVRQKGEFAQ
jgi:hypothetical protein